MRLHILILHHLQYKLKSHFKFCKLCLKGGALGKGMFQLNSRPVIMPECESPKYNKTYFNANENFNWASRGSPTTKSGHVLPTGQHLRNIVS